MARVVGIGHQDFGRLIQDNLFYIDKTDFIRQWWENRDAVTLIARPRRFGKTLTMSMLEYFFSVKYAGRGGLFKGAFHLERGRVPAAAGNLACHQPFLCRREGDILFQCQEKDMPAHCGTVQQI